VRKGRGRGRGGEGEGNASANLPLLIEIFLRSGRFHYQDTNEKRSPRKTTDDDRLGSVCFLSQKRFAITAN